jgi:hypothetical protein
MEEIAAAEDARPPELASADPLAVLLLEPPDAVPEGMVPADQMTRRHRPERSWMEACWAMPERIKGASDRIAAASA